MQKALIWISLIVVVVVGGKIALEKMFVAGENNAATERVRRIFDGMKAGGNKDQAIAMYELGAFAIPGGGEGFRRAADAFDRWWKEKDLPWTIASYELSAAEIKDPATALAGAVVIVSGTVEGKPFRLRAQRDQRLLWLN
jgi:hypothetical protein